MNQRNMWLLLAGGLGLLLSQTSGAVPISDARARQLAPAVAEVLLQRASTTALLQYCGQHYPRLHAAAGRAKTRWLQRNRQVLQRADRLREQLLRGIKREQSRFAAELFALDIDKAVQHSVQQFQHNLAGYPPPQQHRLCNHLILSVRAGDWDVARKQAKAFAIMENIH